VRRFPPPLPGVAWGGFLLGCAAPGPLPVLPALRRSVTASPAALARLLDHRDPDGSGGSGRDQRTGTSGDLGQAQLPPLISTLNRALAVNRMACRRSLRDRNRARPAFGPFRRPGTEATKFRYAVFRSARAC